MSETPRAAHPTRRDFVRTLGAAGLTAAVPLIGVRSIEAMPSLRTADEVGPKPTDPAESAVARLFATLSSEQRETICFPFDHPLRSRVENNWAIVEPTIDDMTAEQQELCREIMKGICSEDGFDRFMRQMDEDYGGFGAYHVALFGEPGSGGPFEWVLSGRHDTLRADGNSVPGAAFGGPIFYGHASKSFNEDASHTGNVWWYQGEQANAIFKTLDESQRAQALVDGSRAADASRTIELKGEKVPERGLLVSELDDQQKQMVRTLIEAMLSPFREADQQEVLACIEAAGGVDPMRLTYYTDGDIGEDGVWDVWKVEGPAFAWYFHGEPHVHTWLNVARTAPGA
ncbi:DUF3500 domain-containing protein [Tautonia sociabilis]|uniref:DUF3500 domain-containing protein n=1 Tax=Tautonia sociabilis TaxID=2080755 RepID=A0A432MN35_9BACT|nr:DUF3500 domain-containing protein [Tautonia sociabilis]RUL88607.1 DUF3500 domain-containing protein [Tautonia sociabilis]